MRRCNRREIRHQRSRRSPFDIIRVFFICLPLVVLLLVRSSVRVRLLAFLETVASSSAFSLPRHKLSFASSVSWSIDRSMVRPVISLGVKFGQFGRVVGRLAVILLVSQLGHFNPV